MPEIKQVLMVNGEDIIVGSGEIKEGPNDGGIGLVLSINTEEKGEEHYCLSGNAVIKIYHGIVNYVNGVNNGTI